MIIEIIKSQRNNAPLYITHSKVSPLILMLLAANPNALLDQSLNHPSGTFVCNNDTLPVSRLQVWWQIRQDGLVVVC